MTIKELITSKGIFEYEIIPSKEILFAASTAGVLELGQIMYHTDIGMVTSWETWALSAIGAVARVVFAALFGKKSD